MTTQGGPGPGNQIGRGRRAVGTSARTIPEVPDRAVVRARLLDRLDRIDPIGVIRAPSGYGRTTLAAQWAHRQLANRRVVAWASGARWGNQEGAAWAVIRESLTAALRTAGADVPHDATPADLAAAADTVEKGVVLVVDEADELADPADVAPVADLVALSSAVRLLLVTGSRHLLLPGGVAQHPVVEAVGFRTPPLTLTVRDLAFTTYEMQDVARTWGIRLDARRFAELHALVGGWVGLARVMLDDTRPDDEHIATTGGYTYLRDRARPAIADDALLRQALLVVQDPNPTPESVRLILETADELPAGHDNLDLLIRLEAVGVLRRHRSIDGPSTWSTPGLLGEALRRELRAQDPELTTRIHVALARHALSTQPPDARGAVLHAAQAQDWTLMESCWLDFGSYLVATGGPAVDAAFASVPDEVIATSSVLSMARSLGRRRRDDRHDTREMVMRLMNELGGLALDGKWRSRTPAGRWTGAAAALVAARSRGDLRRARIVMRDTEVAAARAGISGSTSSRSYWWFLVQAGRTALLDDDLAAALELPTRAYELADPHRAPDIAAAAAAHVALVHALDGRCVETDRWMERHVEALDPEWESHIRDRSADVAEAMLATDRLDLHAAETALKRVDLDLRSPDVTWPFLLRARVRFTVLTGDAERALAEVEQVERTEHVWLSQAGMVHRILLRLRAEALLALGEFHRVSDLFAETDPTGVWSDVPRTRWYLLTGDPHAALRSAVTGGRRRRVRLSDRMDLLALEAWAAMEARQPQLAVRAFHTVRRLAEEQDALRPFAHLPLDVLDRLVDISDLPFDDEQVARLRSTHDVVPEAAELVPLTPRERKVLTLLDRYDTTREVADALVVSVNTVRKQVLSIYSKLGVHDRESALRRGHELGVLGQDHRRA